MSSDEPVLMIFNVTTRKRLVELPLVPWLKCSLMLYSITANSQRGRTVSSNTIFQPKKSIE